MVRLRERLDDVLVTCRALVVRGGCRAGKAENREARQRENQKERPDPVSHQLLLRSARTAPLPSLFLLQFKVAVAERGEDEEILKFRSGSARAEE
jgi:hypothetical protein